MTRTMHLSARRRALFAGVAAGVSLLLTGCGTDNDSGGTGSDTNAAGATTAAAATFNDADVMFAQQMIPHHQQVVDMATLAQSKAKSPALKTLTGQMKTSETAVVQGLTAMLTAWGKPTTMEGMAHGSMPGMTSESDMKMLESMSGTEFDRMFIQMMITHHNGSMQMTMDQQSKGANPDAIAMAKDMHTKQTAQVSELERILDGLG